MKKYVSIFALVSLIAPLSIGCGDDDEEGVDMYVQEGSFNVIEDGSAVAGSSATLVRTSGSLDVTISSAVTAGEAHTLWVCGFNSPQLCAGNGDMTPSCSSAEMPGDDGPGVGGGFCQYGGGVVADANGSVSISASIDSTYNGTILSGDGLSAFTKAEIVLMLRTHGPALDGAALNAQLTSVNGGCEAGDANEGLCETIHSASFAAP